MLRGPEQLAEWIEQEFNSFLLREVEPPLGCLITVTGVRITNDRQHATVVVSVLPISKVGTVKAILERKMNRARKFLSGKTNRHRVPMLHLEITDDALKDRMVERALEESKIKTKK